MNVNFLLVSLSKEDIAINMWVVNRKHLLKLFNFIELNI